MNSRKNIFVIHEDSGEWAIVKSVRKVTEAFPALEKVKSPLSERFRKLKKHSDKFSFAEWGYKFYYQSKYD
jgi:hypothetical protein